MTRLSALVAAAAVVSLVGTCTPASAQTTSIRPPAQATLARNGQGAIQGLVRDTRGRPLAGAVVSALGSTVAFALTGHDGRFLLDSLPPGPYAVRIHLDGFVPAPRQMADVRPSGTALVSVALRALTESPASAMGTPLLAAAMLPLGGAPLETAAEAVDGTTPASAEVDHDHSETAWRLRHVKRSVLKNVDSAAVVADGSAVPTPDSRSFFGRAFESGARLAATLFSDTDFTGQVNFVTTSAFNSPSELWETGALGAASVAYVSLGAPVGRFGDWAVSGALTPGSMSSWFIAGSLNANPASPHRYVAGLSYSAQRNDRANPLALAAISGGARSLGTIYGFDEWTVSPQLSVGYGLSYAWQDYASGEWLVSPRASVTLTPLDHLRVRAVVARYAAAPGSDEFLRTPANRDGLWLPAQRTFSPWSEQEGFRAQTTDHVEMGVERDIDAYVVGFRTFFQRVDDQASAVFATPAPSHPAASLGHYYIASVGDVQSRGWGVSVSRPIGSSVKGSVDYSQTTARWQVEPDQTMIGAWEPGRHGENERIHDLTTSVETDIPQTATRVFVIYKLNTGFARPDVNRVSHGFDSRFDLQVNQSLPFLNFTSADWEVLVAVCNLSRDASGERSVYDELLVVRPPKRVVGGLRVRF